MPAPAAAASLQPPTVTVEAANGRVVEDPAQGGKSRRRRSTPRRRSSASRAAAAPVAALRYTSPHGANALQNDLSYMVASRVRSGQWGVMVVSVTRGDTLYSYNADQPMQPASTMKLFTAALAFDRLGPQYRFSTDVLREGTLAPDGTLQGNLIIRGDGDPGFSNRFMPGGADAPMRELARRVAAAGVKRVSGDVIGDATGFEAQKVPDGWLARNLQSGYAARVSALSINENLMWVAVYPAAGKGAARVAIEPSASAAVPLTANVRTVPGSTGAQIRLTRNREGAVTVTGWIGSRSIPRRYEYVIEDPAIFTTASFRDALRAEGVEVAGAVKLGPTPAAAAKVASLESQPLEKLAAVMNRESVNHFAELLFRNAARGPERDTVGTAQRGYTLLKGFLEQKAGAPQNAVFAADGSGLSTLDRVTPRAMIKLLAYAHESPWASAFHASLPVAGESELLRHRMKYTPAQGNLHAKTGTTNTVISLAGYVTAQNGEVLAFSFVYNGNDRWNAKETIDAMGPTMAGFVRE
ncbi:MAG TPA: D-alanyl-D-alanine carboxypeptidase/D-alanyl-D-alanine-endopeptidase [Gemmatimonadaceae bacterium]|nr:D-alanyl-D-alanine carboxypeptidase/D-alanyl-D-alanine-endopeptidase [Gemmatimonadaceae bacterium]